MNTTLESKTQDSKQRASHEESQSAISYPSRTIVRAKLEMTEPGDEDEQEADLMADSVIHGGKIARSVSSGHSGGGIALPSRLGNQLASLQGHGCQLSGNLKNQMETGFGRDFSNVRIHTDSAAAALSDSISAKAFTYGSDIYFNRGQFNPETTSGQHLIAHELTHIVQGGDKLSKKDMCRFDDPNEVTDEFFDSCEDLEIPNFNSCKDEFDPVKCVAHKYDNFHFDYLNNCDSKINSGVDQWKNKTIAHIASNKDTYKKAADIFYSKLAEFDESLIRFSAGSVTELIASALGIASIFLPKAGQVVATVLQGIVSSSELGTILDTALNANTDYIMGKSQLIRQYDYTQERLESMVNIVADVMNVRGKQNVRAPMTSRDLNYCSDVSTIGEIRSTLPPATDDDGKMELELTKMFNVKKVGEETWEALFAQTFIQNNLSVILNNDAENEDTYYNTKEGKLDSASIFSKVCPEHDLINKVLDTFFSDKYYNKARSTDQFKIAESSLKEYNKQARIKLRQRAFYDAQRGSICFNPVSKEYEQAYVDAYYIDTLNAIIKVDGVSEEDRVFNRNLRPILREIALKQNNVYFDGEEYIQFGVDRYYVDSLNKIIKYERGYDSGDYSFNAKMRNKLYQKIKDDYFHYFVYDSQKNVYIVLGSGASEDVMVCKKTINMIISIDGASKDDLKYNDSIYPVLKDLADKDSNVKYNSFYGTYSVVHNIRDSKYLEALNYIIKHR